MARNSSQYVPYPTEEVRGGGGTPFSVKATPESFGAQVSRSVAKLGEEGFDVATQFAEEAAEAKANDILANQWSPEAAKMRTAYDSLQGPDKVHGYESYVGGLKQFQKSLLENETNPLTKKHIQNWTTGRIITEEQNASKDLATWQKQFNNESTWNLIKSQSDYAADNYNNPSVIGEITAQNDAQLTRVFIDNGHDILTPEGATRLEMAQQTVRGEMAVGMITRAVKTGDMNAANKMRAEYGTVIPGYQQLQIDNVLGVENLRQTSIQSVTALKNGGPIPNAFGAPPAQVQAVVADNAHGSGVDVNHALTILRIESANGQNVGKRGTIGQTGSGGTLEDQAADLVREAAKSREVADRALGRSSMPWEQYICYQQGEGGGPALLKAAAEDPTKKAVDVLAPLYKSPKIALSAVIGNGGNATMTAEDFTEFLRKKYESNYNRAKCDFPRLQGLYAQGKTDVSITPTSSPGQMIIAAHDSTGETVQPAATPIQAFQNFNKKAPGMLARIEAIPNSEVRDGVMNHFQHEQSMYRAAAEAYSGAVQLDAQKLAVDPSFTSVDQIPPELRAQLIDLPETMHMMRVRAEYNLTNPSGAITPDMRQYGTGYFDLFSRIYAPEGSPERITNITEIQGHLNKDLTVAGYDKLAVALSGTRTPEGKAEGNMQKAFLDRAENALVLDKLDAAGQEKFLAFQAWFFPAYEKAKADGKSAEQLLSPDSPDYMGKAVDAFNRTPAERIADRLKDPMEFQKKERTLADIVADVKSGKISNDAGKSEALSLGFIRE